MKDALRGPYFRMHANILNSPKLAKLSPATKWTWVELMAVASAQCGFSGDDCQITYDIEALAWYMRRSDHDILTRQLGELESARLIKRTEKGIEIHEWEFWQQPSTNKERDHQSNVLRAKRNQEKRVSKVTAPGQHQDSTVTAVGQQNDSVTAAGQQSDSSRTAQLTAAGQQSDLKMTAPEQKQSRAEQSSDSANQRVAPSAPPTGGLPVAQKPKGPDFKRTPAEQAEFERSIAEGIRDWKAKGFKLHADDQAILDRHFPEQAKAKYKRTPEQEKELKDFVASLSPEHRALLEAKEAAGK